MTTFWPKNSTLNPPRGPKKHQGPIVAHQFLISMSKSIIPPIFIQFGELFILEYTLTPKIDFKPTQRSKEASGTLSCPSISDQHVKIYNPTNFYSIWWHFYFRVLYDLQKFPSFSYNSKNTHFWDEPWIAKMISSSRATTQCIWFLCLMTFYFLVFWTWFTQKIG